MTVVKSTTGLRVVCREGRGEVYLYGPIGESFFGDSVTTKQVADELKALRGARTIDVRINSDGGDVFAGRTIYTLLQAHPATITVHVDGLAASIASLIAMVGEEIHMAEGAMMMVHNPWMMAMGDDREMERAADLLRTVKEQTRNTYASRTGQSPEFVQELMDAETWMTAEEALENGFATSIVEDLKVAASVRDPNVFKHLPKALRPNRASAGAIIDRMRAA